MGDLMENLFSLFCTTKFLWDCFGLSRWKPLKKFSRSYRNKNRKTETKRVLDNLRMPKLHARKLHNSCHRVLSLQETRCFAKYLPLFCFEQVKTLKNFSNKLFASKIRKKKGEAETKSSVWDLKKKPKLAQILEQSSGTRRVCVSVFILFWSLYKTNRFHFAPGLFSNRSQKTSKCGKNISNTLACGSCATSLFLRHFDVICDLLLNRRTATWNLWVNGSILEAASSGFPKAQWGARNKREARELEAREKRLRRMMETNIPRKLIASDRGRGSVRG